jgi:hypothetical protein
VEGSFRPPLDLRGYLGQIDPEGGLERTEGAEDLSWGVTARPFLWGTGEAECSTCTDLAPSPQVIIDANGYYRALGFAFPYAGITKKQLRLAYHRVHGERSVWLTAALKTLLDPVERRRYDMVRVGDIYMDLFVQDWFRRQAFAEARRRNLHGGHRATREQVLDEWGLTEDTPKPALDSLDEVVHDPQYPTDEGCPEAWEWSYYLWGSRSTNTAKLSLWQGMLIRECISLGAVIRFCVGFSSRRNPARWATGVIGQHHVIYLREDVEPTDELAALAVSAVLREERTDEARKVITS